MNVMKIALGSQNPAKIAAVQAVFERVWSNAQVVGVSVPSGVSDMPMSDGECLIGARNRAEAAQQVAQSGFGVGLEGGVDETPAGLMLVGWVVIVDASGREGVASTARLPLPDHIANRVRAGQELGPVMDDLLGQTKSNHRGGAIGALTAGLIPRSHTFAMAVAYALSPFITPDFLTSTPAS